MRKWYAESKCARNVTQRSKCWLFIALDYEMKRNVKRWKAMVGREKSMQCSRSDARIESMRRKRTRRGRKKCEKQWNVRKTNCTLNCTLLTQHFISWILNRLVLTPNSTPFAVSSVSFPNKILHILFFPTRCSRYMIWHNVKHPPYFISIQCVFCVMI